MKNPFTLLDQPYSSQMKKGNQVERQANPFQPSLKPLDVSLRYPSISPSPTPRLLLATIAWLAGITAILAGCATHSVSESPTPNPTVTSVSAEKIESYARAVVAIEQIRRAAYEEIQKMTNNETVPDVTCTEPESITALSKNIQGIAVNYCSRSKKFIEDEGLTMELFNGITNTAKANSELQQRIQSEIVRLQPKQ
jgi:hypothetical protein